MSSRGTFSRSGRPHRRSPAPACKAAISPAARRMARANCGDWTIFPHAWASWRPKNRSRRFCSAARLVFAAAVYNVAGEHFPLSQSLSCLKRPNFPKSLRANSAAAEKVRSFPHTPGVYLMKDAAGRVIYVGKAKNLRAGPAATSSRRPPKTTHYPPGPGNPRHRLPRRRERSGCPAHGSPAHQGHAAQVQPRPPRQQDLSLPENLTHEDYPARRDHAHAAATAARSFTGRSPAPRALRGALHVLQKIFKFRTCTLDIQEDDPRWRWFRPCLLASIGQCTAPCNFRISREDYRKNIHRLQQFLEGKKRALLGEMREEMATAAKELHFEEAARLRDEIHLLETLDERGELETHVQPEVFPVDPAQGPGRLAEGAAPGQRRGRSRVSTSPTPAAPRPWPARCSSSTAALQARLPAVADPHRGGHRRRGLDPRGRLAAFPAARRERGRARHPPGRRRQGAIARGLGGLGTWRSRR